MFLCRSARFLNRAPADTTGIATRRHFYSWLNYMFNRVSKSRISAVGPDRACAEWLMRNGAFIKWKGQENFVKHYNNLPLDARIKGDYFIEAINADHAALTHHGFDHFDGCAHIQSVRFHTCWFIDDSALSKMHHLSNSLVTLEISKCDEVTEDGLMHLAALKKLEKIRLSSLGNVIDLDKCLGDLNKALPSCKITTFSL